MTRLGKDLSPRKHVVMQIDQLAHHLGIAGDVRRGWVDGDYVHIELEWVDEGEPPPGFFRLALGGYADETYIAFEETVIQLKEAKERC